MQPPHIGHCLGSALLSSTHLCPHFRHTHSATLHNSIQTSVSTLKHLIFFHHQEEFVAENLGMEASPSSSCFVGSYNLNFFRYKRYFFAAFGAFTIVSLNYLVWRFQFCAFVENKTALFANYLLRHGLTAILDRNTNVTRYLYITTKRRNALE
jgi:hypothetical protein